MQLCDYGCGQEAKHQFKNGKWCCGENFRSCPIQREKLSKSIRRKNYPPWNKGLTKETDERMKKMSETIKGTIKGPPSEETKKKQSEIMKGKNTGPRSEEIKKKISKTMIFTLKDYKEKHPFLFKIEELRENEKGEIQGHCKNHNCKNSKEKGGWFTLIRNQLKNRKDHICKSDGNGGSYFYCSQKCKDTCPLYYLKNDPYKSANLPHTYQENQLWRQIVLDLDKDLCQYCGEKATHVHHIKPVKTHPHLALDPDNGISFCEECHYKIGHKTGTECSTGNLAKAVQQGCVLGGQQLNMNKEKEIK